MHIPEENPKLETDLVGLKHQSIDGAVATALSQAVTFAISLVSQIWLARLISPAEYGLVAMVAPILAFISIISDLGIGSALIQQRTISQSQLSALFWLNAIISSILSLILVAMAPVVGLLYHEPRTVPITIVLAALFLVSTFSIHPSALLNRNMRLVQRAVIDCVQAVVGLAFGVFSAMRGWGYWSLVFMQAASTVTAVLLAWLIAGWTPSQPRWDRSALSILRFGSSLTLSNIAVYFSMSADNIIVGAVNGKVALGLYDKAYRLVVMPLVQLSAPVGRVAVPLLSRLQAEPQHYAAAYRRMVQLPTLVFTPALICGMFLAPQLVYIFLGPTWSGISPVFSWVCFGGIGSSVYGSASWLLTSQGRGRDLMKWSAITSSISLLSFVIGIHWGAVGVACVAGVGFTLIQTPLIIRAATKTGPVSTRYIVRALTPLAISFVITTPVAYLYSKLVHLNRGAQLGIGILITCGVYLLVISLMSSGRELLSGTFHMASTYFSRFRNGWQRAIA